jgi:hypothetical protein
MIQLTDKAFAIPMPKDAESCELRGARPGRQFQLLSFYGEGEAVELPTGEYKILVFNSSTATEEQAKKVVEEYVLRGNIRFTDYTHEYMWCSTAKDSLESLLRSKGLDEKNNYAIIEKQPTNGE